MQTSRVITNVKVITNIEKPVIVFELQGHPAVVRNPKQALTDLQNSGRVLDVQSEKDPRFVQECFALIGATLSGDLKAFKAGDTYKIEEGHPDVLAGTAKIGDTKVAEKDGVWVNGFLSIPLTMMERQMQANANAYATILNSMFNGFAPVSAPASTPVNSFTAEEEPVNEAITEATGTKRK